MLGLHEKLDLADAAAAELDVVAGDRDLLVAAEGVDLPLHRVHVGDRRVVEVAPPDEGRKLVEERLAGFDITGAGPRLDEGRALPGLALALVVSDGEIGGDRELGRTRVGSQAQIDAEHVAVRRALLQHAHEIAREADEEGRRIEVIQLGVRVVEQDQVDIARIVELKGPELAHGERAEAGAFAGPLRVFELELAPALRGEQ